MSNYPENFETDTKLFQIRFHNVYMGDIWAADADSALAKAQTRYPDVPKHLFEMKFAGDLYPVKKLTIKDICTVLDERKVLYHAPVGDECQLILSGSSDIIEGGYGNGDDRWELYVRATKTKQSQTFVFKNLAELSAHLDAVQAQSLSV